MHATTPNVLSSLFIVGALTACGARAVDREKEEDTGAIELSLSAAPTDARGCLEVVVRGEGEAALSFTFEVGSSTFDLGGLPLGAVEIEARAFDENCVSINARSVPTFISEEPTLAYVDGVVSTPVVLHLTRNGRASVGVEFDELPWIASSTAPVDLVVIGDTPYGGVQIADFPRLLSDIGAATPTPEAIVHVGDIKNGSSACDTEYFNFVLDNFNRSSLPLIYTPGDNEWTDCHRLNNGAYDPLERLATVRSMFFPHPGLALGGNPKPLLSQATLPGFESYVENVLWAEAGSVFVTVHVVGSNNDLLPWFTDDTTGTKLDDPERRNAEQAARTAANLEWLTRAFATAHELDAAAVIVMMQADMWDGTPVDGFDSTVQRLAALALDAGKPVLLIEGDSHIFKVDNPLAEGDAIHGVTTPVPNLTRIVVQGSTTAPLTEWVRLHVDPMATPPFSWTRSPR
jgi:Calcineurin-like phosphoesterase